MTRRVSIFDSPFLLGFDDFERMVDRVARNASDSYPPYNIEQVGDNRLRISIAVAGFTMDDLTVQMEQNQLVIRGKRKAEEEEQRVYLHRGIATRQFQRAFMLSDDIEVKGAHLDNGLLHIDLERIITETAVRMIEIEDKSKKDKKSKKADNTIDVESVEKNDG
ncbi:MAG: Hsp20 family protein [Alphaproteobacteria bacterium]|nr:MAG: Hsp20 family protein [Alphaproteobacteria bacterium]